MEQSVIQVNTSANFINFNGATLRSDKAILTVDNRGFRYGDGLFETIRVRNGQILLADYHFDRLMAGLCLLQLETPPYFTPEKLAHQILDLCRKNDHYDTVRVRMIVFRGGGDLPDPGNHLPQYIIQSAPLPSWSGELNETGLATGIFPDGRKSCDLFSNLKSNNYLLYAMAGLYAQKHGLNDSLVLNNHGRIADSSIANLFYIKEEKIWTPPLSEGCVAGVMRRFLMELLPKAGFTLNEKQTTIEDLEDAEEVFLTNALKGIRWVQSFGKSTYRRRLTALLYQELLASQ